jgi:transcription termination factor NusB
VLRRVFEDGAWADRILPAEADRLGLDPRERALATRLAYGAVQRRATLDHVAERLAGRPAEALDPVVLAALRLGIFQLVHLDRVPAHAAVAESVELAKGGSRGGAGLVNAVLRRAAREAPAIVAALGDATPEEAALRHSHPEWIARLWWDALGPDAARSLLAADNEPAEAAVRVNTLRADPAGWPPAWASRSARGRRRVRRACRRGSSSTPPSTPTARPGGPRATTCPSRGRRWPSPTCSVPGRGSASWTCAPRPAARPRTSRRSCGARARSWPSSTIPGRAGALRRTPTGWAPAT